METTPGVCEWYCSRDFLPKALGEIHHRGSVLLAVVPYRFRHRGESLMVTEWIVYYRNPRASGPEDGNG